MGSQLARAAYVMQGDKLEGRALRLLVWMSLHARDEDASPVYFGGSDALLLGLGYGAALEPQRRRSAVRELRRVVAQLVAAGAVVPLLDPRPGVRQAYALYPSTMPREPLTHGDEPVDDEPRSVDNLPGSVDAGTPPTRPGAGNGWGSAPPEWVGLSPRYGWGSAPAMGGAQPHPYPKNTTNPNEDTIAAPSVSTELGAAADVADTRAHLRRPVVLESGGDVTVCARGHGIPEPACPACVEVGT